MKKHDLKKQKRKKEQAILDKDKEWYNGFMEEHYPEFLDKHKQKTKNRLTPITSLKFLVASVTIVAVVISLVFLLPLFFSEQTDDPTPKKNYLVENERPSSSNLTALNLNIQDFTIFLGNIYSIDIIKFYDSVSNDVLYYRVSLENESAYESILIHFYVNPDYKGQKDFNNFDEFQTVTVNNFFVVNYSKRVIDGDWILTLQYQAVVECSNTIVYIEYEQLSLNEESNFFGFFEETFQIK